MARLHVYEPVGNISEKLCVEFFKTCEKLQKPDSDGGVHYLDIMKEMHVGFDRLQDVLTSITRNWAYFKVHHGYTYRGWTVNVDRHKRLVVCGKPMLHLRVTNYGNQA